MWKVKQQEQDTNALDYRTHGGYRDEEMVVQPELSPCDVQLWKRVALYYLADAKVTNYQELAAALQVSERDIHRLHQQLAA